MALPQNQPWHTLSTEQVFQKLASQPGGLSQAEAAARLLEYGPNELQAAHRISPWEILLEQFKNVLILLLLAAIVYLPFLQEPFSTYALTLTDWLIVGGLALTIIPVLELAKWIGRKGWFGALD